MGTAFSQTARFLAATIIGAGLGVAGCAPHASALPAGFPDLNNFAAAPVDNYIVTGPKGPKRFVNFSTPYNIECSFIATIDPVPAGESQGMSCDGAIPGYSDSCATGMVADWGPSGFRFQREPSGCPPDPANSGALLSAGQKVSYQNATCAVGGDGLVACLDTSAGQHGFVVKPSGSVAF